MALFNFLSKKLDTADYEQIGINLSEKIYFKELAIFIATSYIANTISKCEIKTFVKGEEVQDELYYMLNYNPNQNQNSSQFMNQLISRYYRNGESLVVPHKGFVYCADGWSRDERPLKEDVFENVSVNGETISKKFKASDVFHFQLDDTNVKQIIDQLYSDYGLLMAAAIEAYKRGNSEKYKLILENVQAGDAAFAKLFNEVIKGNLDNFINSDKAVYPQFRGQSLERMDTGSGVSSSDVIALRKEIFETVAQAFKIPMSMMYGNITNMNEIVKVYLSVCIDPLAQMISEELTRKTNTYESWKEGSFIRIDTTKVNHVSILEVADKADKAIASGIANIDDMRERFNMNPLNTDFSKAHFITKNYELADKALDALEGGEPIEE